MKRIQVGEAQISVRYLARQAECVREINRWLDRAWEHPRGDPERVFFFRIVRVHRRTLRETRRKLQDHYAAIRERRRHEY